MTVVTLPEVKTHLNIRASLQDDDGELQAFIERAEAAISARCGPLEPTAKTSRVDSGVTLLLPVTPVVSLTSITPIGGTAIPLTNISVTPGGVVSYDFGGAFYGRRYDVAYQAGRSVCPEDLKLGVLELVRHMWDTQRGGGSRRIGSAPSENTSNTLPGAAYLFPFRVEQLIAPYVQLLIA